MVGYSKNPSPSPAEIIGIFLLGLSALLFFISPPLAAIPLILFLLLCFSAPFFPNSVFFVPTLSRFKSAEDGIILTFDDGPSPKSTPVILELLAKYRLHATFFVIGEKAAKYPELISAIIAQGHAIGNHSWDHDYFLMLRSYKTLENNVRKTQQLLKQLGIRPVVFRPPVGITNSKLKKILAKEGLINVGYTCRALDRGNRNVHNLSNKILCRLRSGDIVMLHDLLPPDKQQEQHWQNALDHLFEAIAKNHTTLSLEKIIDHPAKIDSA